MKDKEKNIEVAGIIGELKWNKLRNAMIYELIRCENEIDFLDFMGVLAKSMGTKKQMGDVRKELGLKPYTEEEIKLIDKLKVS